MQQVPQYLLIGSGKVARHFCYYFSLLNLPYKTWTRRNNSLKELPELIKDSTNILILLRDDVITSFVFSNKMLWKNKYVIHFSGSLIIADCFSAHPLASFTDNLYDLAIYKNIPFILGEDAPDFNKLLPGLPNKSFRIPNKLRPLYHALCVLSGNFTVLLWQKFFIELEEKFNLPKEIAMPYLQNITNNLQDFPESALSGPLARNDKKTIAANLQALEGDPYQEIYKAFVGIKSC